MFPKTYLLSIKNTSIWENMGNVNAFWAGRFRSARQRKRAVKSDFEKQLRKLGKERQTLSDQLRKLGYEPLVPPVQKGFKRFFVLREDVARTPRAAFFQEILDKINTVQYSDTRKFTKTRRFMGRKIKVLKEQLLDSISLYEWHKLQLPAEQAFYFEQAEELTAYHEWRTVFRFTEPWRFRLKIAPNLITRIRIKDAVLEKRMDEIDNYMERNFLNGKYFRLTHGAAGYYSHRIGEKIRYSNPLKNKPLDWILEMARQDDPEVVLS
ncbi:hypothetical protein I5M27_06400 [Adhaeribacter sp. BT258]|uniref:Uncharacterized protein n=1 Tax=Adhaeribacter terrigena TaxID=2793070 RepID=A0ABS1BZW8_9BACT|nr:hypothetical protein [Adhaeribacter terrigena]MBK0402608.1 hypothetical protein [Adhaeribacter terrigena]